MGKRSRGSRHTNNISEGDEEMGEMDQGGDVDCCKKEMDDMRNIGIA